MSDDLRDAARAYLAHDGSGIGRHDEWAGDFDAMDLAVARDRLRAALATPDVHKPGDNHRYRIECEACGQSGVIRLSVNPERWMESDTRSEP